MKARVFLKQLGAFEQDVKVTLCVERDVPIEAGDDVIVRVRATVQSAVQHEDGMFEIDLRDVRPVKIEQVIRKVKK